MITAGFLLAIIVQQSKDDPPVTVLLIHLQVRPWVPGALSRRRRGSSENVPDNVLTGGTQAICLCCRCAGPYPHSPLLFIFTQRLLQILHRKCPMLPQQHSSSSFSAFSTSLGCYRPLSHVSRHSATDRTLSSTAISDVKGQLKDRRGERVGYEPGGVRYPVKMCTDGQNHDNP